MFKCQSTLPKATLQVLSKHAALDMTGNAIDYADLEPICVSDMNWHNVISQSVEVKCLFFRCRLQLKADRWRLSLFIGQGGDKPCLSCFPGSKLRICKHDLNKVTQSGMAQEPGNKQVIPAWQQRVREEHNRKTHLFQKCLAAEMTDEQHSVWLSAELKGMFASKQTNNIMTPQVFSCKYQSKAYLYSLCYLNELDSAFY